MKKKKTKKTILEKFFGKYFNLKELIKKSQIVFQTNLQNSSNIIEMYFLEKYGILPIIENVTNSFLFYPVLEDIEKNFQNIEIFRKIQEEDGIPMELCLKTDKDDEIEIFIQLSEIGEEEMDGYKNIRNKPLQGSDTIINTIQFVYYPCESNETKIQNFKKIIKKHTLDYTENSAFVGLITMDNMDGFDIQNINISSKVGKWEELDLHYGKGFQKTYDKIIKSLKEKNKGLLLFHGDPGTGKTYCIRQIIKDLSLENKTFLYFPTRLMDNLMDPSFISFLVDFVKTEDHELVLIIEDAEAVVQKREDSFGNEGVSNILNLTEGILNDILKIQIICTFNIDMAEIDEALKRNSRMIADIHFSKRSIEEAQKILDYLNLDYKTNKEMSLSDIYTKSQENEIIKFGGNDKKRPMGFI